MYNKNELALIWLNDFEPINIKKKHLLLEKVQNASEIFDMVINNYSLLKQILGDKNAELLKENSNNEYIQGILTKMLANKVQAVTLESEMYPCQLKEIFCPPICLYCKGNLQLLNSNLLGVVGTRRPTRYGKDITRQFVRELVYSGFGIVSGMAKGIDTVAHSVALEEEAQTIAVVACGLDIIYPAENRELFNNLVENGLIISEYPIGFAPLTFRFPERNRIISGLSRGVLVTEAGKNSGSLITVNCALEQNRNVYIVPGNINSPQSSGCNEKLMQLQGAMVICANDVLADFNLKGRDAKPSNIQMDFLETQIVEFLRIESKHFEEILQFCDIEVNKLIPLLMKMEILGIIKKLPSNYYSL
ncbi:MAG: DNA-processing protein DprA [Clostridia bacterium]